MNGIENKIKLVVCNVYTLGYINPEQPNIVQHLKTSVLKGSPHMGSPMADCASTLIGSTDKVQLASARDFENFRVSFKGFDNKEVYIYSE